jgi:flagellar protein FlbD
MIDLTRLNDTTISINPFMIEIMEQTPDTVIQFNSGHKIVVKEKVGQIQKTVQKYFSRLIAEGIKNAKKE